MVARDRNLHADHELLAYSILNFKVLKIWHKLIVDKDIKLKYIYMKTKKKTDKG